MIINNERITRLREKEKLREKMLTLNWDSFLTFRYGLPTTPRQSCDIVVSWVWNDTQIQNLMFVTERNRINPKSIHTHVLIGSENPEDSVKQIRQKVNHVGKVWSEPVRSQTGVVNYLTKFVGWADPGFKEIDWDLLQREKWKSSRMINVEKLDANEWLDLEDLKSCLQIVYSDPNRPAIPI